jgi:hypothetical protein
MLIEINDFVLQPPRIQKIDNKSVSQYPPKRSYRVRNYPGDFQIFLMIVHSPEKDY